LTNLRVFLWKYFRKNRRKPILKKLLLALFFTIVIVSPANAQSTLASQEKCAEGAKKFFFDRIQYYGGSWGGSPVLMAMGGTVLRAITIKSSTSVLY
jgi:hypothetical protein